MADPVSPKEEQVEAVMDQPMNESGPEGGSPIIKPLPNSNSFGEKPVNPAEYMPMQAAPQDVEKRLAELKQQRADALREQARTGSKLQSRPEVVSTPDRGDKIPVSEKPAAKEEWGLKYTRGS